MYKVRNYDTVHNYTDVKKYSVRNYDTVRNYTNVRKYDKHTPYTKVTPYNPAPEKPTYKEYIPPWTRGKAPYVMKEKTKTKPEPAKEKPPMKPVQTSAIGSIKRSLFLFETKIQPQS